MAGDGASEPKASKREQILAGALSLFREVGYERASVDAIAARAGVSKATIYSHFRDKRELFRATFGAETESIRAKFLALLETPSGDIEGDLRRIGSELIRLATAPASVCRFRIVVAEVERFPELARELHTCGLAVGHERMARYFQRAGGMGLLEVHDPVDAAIDFASLCTFDLQRKVQLGILEEVSEDLLAAHVDRAVRTFLRAYRPLAAGRGERAQAPSPKTG